jgi:hypothetical protein
MSDPRPDAIRRERNDGPSLQTAIYRYFFYGWLFRDASSGSALERAAALRHNRNRARWLPTYLRRWAVCAASLVAFETWAEQALDNALVSAALAVALILVLVFLVVTAVCWTMLRDGRRHGG